ncbi:MAG: hypothetical protein CEE38_08210 [Planctomycetes bacterium B3_Pla]|nr:MAG: hypothetical protein CEE38_08210 [Planctomycetes bacterium B3_Pla]
MQDSDIEEVISEIADRWMAIDGVNGIAKGKEGDKDCILVFVSKNTRKIEETTPRQFKGFPVRVMEVGNIGAQEQPQ